jgi:Lamin Tail Domain
MKKSLTYIFAALAAGTLASNAAGLKITEVMYTGLYGEYVEITNTNSVGGASIDLTGYVYSDNHRATSGSNSVDLSVIGSLAPGKSAIITEADPSVFETVTYGTFTGVTKPSGLVIVGNVTVNLGRNDEVNIYDNIGTLVDRLTFNDQATAGTDPAGPRTEEFSAVPGPSTVLGDNKFKNWVLSVVGTSGAWKSGNHNVTPNGNGTVGSPGTY